MPKVDTERPKHTRDTLDYMQQMIRELKIMADAERQDMLSYLLEMAYFEVSDSIHKLATKPAKKSMKKTAA